MKINIDKIKDRYAFSIDDNGKVLYSSSKQFFLIPTVRPTYQYAWEAYRDAKSIPAYHVASLSKTSSEEFVKPVVTDISAESMLEDHYTEILDGIDDKARSAKEDEDKQAVYEEIKMITAELLTVDQNLDEDDGKKKIGDMISHLRKVTKKYFKDLLAKDKKEKEEAEAQAELAPPPEPMMPQDPMMADPMMADPMGMAVASKIRVLADGNFEKEILEEFAERICKAIQQTHPSAIYEINEDEKEIEIIEGEEPILMIDISDCMMLTNIIPTGRLSSIYPYHKSTFYQKYWKPIVESIGHIVVDNNSLLVPGKTTLPDFPSAPKSFTVCCYDMMTNQEGNVDVSFKGNKRDSIWIFEATKQTKIAQNVSKYIEQDYSNAIVKCINPQLESIFERTGAVVQVIPGTNYVEVDVDFGEGMDIIRMAEKDIEIVVSE